MGVVVRRSSRPSREFSGWQISKTDMDSRLEKTAIQRGRRVLRSTSTARNAKRSALIIGLLCIWQGAPLLAQTPTPAPTPTPPPSASPAYPLRASANGRYLVDQNDVPFLMV